VSVHLACALAELDRLTVSRTRSMAAGDLRGARNQERRINALLQESWICAEASCDDRVTLGMIAVQTAADAR